MKKYVKNNLFSIIISIFVGLIYVLPNIYYINTITYKGLPFMSSDAETLYLSRINAVYKGCILNCNPYIKEYGYNYPYFDSSVSEIILAVPGILMGIPIVYLKIVYEFLLPLILYILVYSIILRLIPGRKIAVLGALCVVMAPNLINATDLINIPELLKLFDLNTIHNNFLVFSRPVNPQFSSIFFLIYLHLLLSALINKTRKSFILLGIVYGLSFYIYFFTCVFITVVQGIYITSMILSKRYRDSMFNIGYTISGLLIAVPQFVMIYYLFTNSLIYTIPVHHLIRTHSPHITLVGLILFICFIIISYIYYKKRSYFSDQATFIGILVISCFVIRNGHVISGMIVQYDHFEKYMFGPIAVFFVCFVIGDFLKIKVRISNFLCITIGCLVLYNSLLIQYTSYKSNVKNQNTLQNSVSILRWIRDDIPDDVLIYAPISLSNIIPVYTNKYIFWADYANHWIHLPERPVDYVYAGESHNAMIEIGKKYNIDYFIFERNKDLFKNASKRILYSDDYYVVY